MLALNLHLGVKATTQFSGYDFNSFCNFNGASLAAGSGGISLLGGDRDNGDEIHGYFDPVLSDWGEPKPKHLRFLYMGFESDGDLRLSVSDADGLPIGYVIPCRVVGEQQRARVAIRRQPSKRYWTFRVENINGADFSIDAIDCLFIVRSHGLSVAT